MRKYIVFIIFALNVSFSADAMRFLTKKNVFTKKNVLRGIQAASFSAISLPFLGRSYKGYNAMNNNDQNLDELPNMPKVVELWAKTELKNHNIPNSHSVTFKVRVGDNKGWAVKNGKVAIIECGSKQIDRLAKTLTSCSSNVNSGVASDEQKVIDWDLFSLKHEVGHLRGKHTKKETVAWALAPLAIQTLFNTMNVGVKKSLGMNSVPKTSLGVFGRSLLAFGGIIPKVGIGIAGLLLYNRHLEWQADRYACKNTKTKQELIAARDKFEDSAGEFVYNLYDERILDNKLDEIFGNDEYSDLQKIAICESIAPRVQSLGRELFEKDYNIVQVKKDHPFKYRYFKFLLRSAHFVLDQYHPYPGDRAEAIDRALQEFDQKNTQIS